MTAAAAALLAVSAWVGALAGRAVGFSASWSADWWVWILLGSAGAVVAVSSAALRHRSLPRRTTILAAAAVATMVVVGIGAAVRAQHVVGGPLAARVLSLPSSGAGVRLTLQVVGDPQPQDRGGWWMLGRLVSIDGPAEWVVGTRERVMIRSSEPLANGTTVNVAGLATAVQGDAVAWLRSLGIVVEVAVTSSVARSPPGRWMRGTTLLRNRLADAAGRHLPQAQASLLTGLVTGDVSRQPDALADDVLASGLSHLVAVSGSNVALVVAGVMGIVLGLRLGRRLAWHLSILAVWWFVILVRAEPSVIRAALMATLVLGAMVWGRPREVMHLLGMAVVMALLVDPLLAARVGFVLSVAATCGVLLITPRLTPLLRGPIWFRSALAATIGAQIPVSPILVLIGGTVSAATVPANVVAVPAAAVASVIGAVVALLATVSTSAAGMLAVLARPALDVVIWSASTFAGPTGMLVTRWAPVVLGGTAVAVVVRRVTTRGTASSAPRQWAAASLVVVALATGAAALVRGSVPAAGPARMIALDVGQGDAILLADGIGGWMLVDGGPDTRDLRRGLRRHGVDRLDVVVLTHAHADHDAGLDGLFDWMDVGTLVVGPSPLGMTPSPIADQAHQADVPVLEVSVGMSWRMGPLVVAVLSPPATGIAGDPNESSVVLRVQADEGASALLAGDAEVIAQGRLRAEGADIDVDVLKVPHHGGDTNAAGFLAATTPRVAVISVGEGNPFGHPRPEVLADLVGVEVRRTDTDGDVVVPLAVN